MSKFVKGFACALALAGILAMTPAPASARFGWHGWHGGSIHLPTFPGWHGGIHWRSGWFGFPRYRHSAVALGIPVFFAVPYYYSPGSCGWVRTSHWRWHHRVVTRRWRCW
jgi:hypothetical protein